MPPKSVKRQITQDTFDAAVKESIETFGLSPEEAVQDAIEQFELQGVDLSNIEKVVPGSGGATSAQDHPVFAQVQQLSELLQDTSATADTIVAQLKALEPVLGDAEVRKQVLNKAYVVPMLLSAYERHSSAVPVRLALLQALQALVKENQPAQDELGDQGIQLITGAARLAEQDPAVRVAALELVFAAARKNEFNRQKFVGEGVVPLVVRLLSEHSTDTGLVQATCAIMRVLTFNDDERVVAGGAGRNIQELAEHRALDALLAALRQLQTPETLDAQAAVCQTISCLAQRDEVCKAFADQGGLELITERMEAGIGHRKLATQALSALKALAGNDACKAQIALGRPLPLLLSALTRYGDTVSVCEQACGVLSAITLRQPAHSAAVAEAGGIEAVVEALKRHPESQKVVKQACLATRNIVARSTDLRERFLAAGAEELIRTAARQHPQVADMCRGALRDLGLDY